MHPIGRPWVIGVLAQIDLSTPAANTPQNVTQNAAGQRLRYSAIEQPLIPASLARRQRSASHAAAADQKGFNTLLDYANICQLNNMTDRHEALNTGWARLKHVETEHADNDLARMRVNIRALFFDTAPVARSAQWQHLSQAARQDLNLLFAIGDTLRTSQLPIGENAYKNAYGYAWPRLALVLQQNSRPDSALP